MGRLALLLLLATAVAAQDPWTNSSDPDLCPYPSFDPSNASVCPTAGCKNWCVHMTSTRTPTHSIAASITPAPLARRRRSHRLRLRRRELLLTLLSPPPLPVAPGATPNGTGWWASSMQPHYAKFARLTASPPPMASQRRTAAETCRPRSLISSSTSLR